MTPAYIVGLGVLWHLRVRGRLVRLVGFAGLGSGLALWLLAGWAVTYLREEPLTTMHVSSPHNDLEADLIGDHNTWTVWLRADRGLLSREHRVARLGYGDSYPPDVDARFSAPDELTVAAGEQVVYRARFDPHDLDMRDEQCPTPGPFPLLPIGCVP